MQLLLFCFWLLLPSGLLIFLLLHFFVVGELISYNINLLQLWVLSLSVLLTVLALKTFHLLSVLPCQELT